MTDESRWRSNVAIRYGLVALTLAALAIHERIVPSPDGRFVHATYCLWAAVGVYAPFLLPVVRRARAETAASVLYAADLALVSALVYLTGGATSSFVYLYFALIIMAGMSLRPSFGILSATTCSGLLFAVWLAYFLARGSEGGLPLVAPSWRRPYVEQGGFVGGYLFAQVAAFHLVGVLSSLLAVRIYGVRILNREILQASPSGILAVGTSGRIAYINRPARDLLGIHYDEPVVGRPADRVLVSPGTRRILEPLRSLTEMHFETELENLQLDSVPVEVTTRVLFDALKRARGSIALLTDLSMKRRMEEALKQAERLGALSRMAAGIAHEIRNPLAGIRSAAQELGGLAGLADPDRRLFHLIVEESDRLNRIVSDFLEFARIRKPDLASCDIARTIEDVALLLAKASGAGKPIQVETIGSLECRADAEQVKQVVHNLARNALEASPPGQPVTVRAYPQALLYSISYDPRDGHQKREATWGVTIDFIDRGPGLSPTVKKRLFEPFLTTKQGGTGLGLAIAHRIVESHRGTIQVLQDPDQGTVFRVWLPRVPEFLPSPGSPPPPAIVES